MQDKRYDDELTDDQIGELRRILVHTSHAGYSRTYRDERPTVDDVLRELGALAFSYQRVRDDRDAVVTRLAVIEDKYERAMRANC